MRPGQQPCAPPFAGQQEFEAPFSVNKMAVFFVFFFRIFMFSFSFLYPKLTRTYTVRTGLFSCPAVLLFAPCERTPIDDDAENAEIRLLEACIPLSI